VEPSPGPAPVDLVEHERDWAAAFAEEAVRIKEALGDLVVAVEHVGSTAVPGVPAKPVIDLVVGVTRLELGPDGERAMRRLGYVSRTRAGAGRRYFRRGAPRTHFVHLVEWESLRWRQYIYFRDWMRARPGEAAAYAEFKRELVNRCGGNRGVYGRDKQRWIEAALDRAQADRVSNHGTPP
jgi:GrpB-like predicted nucleotidyltransferase (UPF0157 family)